MLYTHPVDDICSPTWHKQRCPSLDLPSLSGQTKISPLVAGELLVWWHHHEGDGDGDDDGVISLCLWGISPTDFASFPHHFASFPPSNLLHFPTKLLHLPNNLLHIPNILLHFPNKNPHFPNTILWH